MRSALIFVTTAACGGGTSTGGVDGSDGPGGAPGPFDPAITDIIVEVDYADGAEPYTGSIIGFGDTWDLTRANLDRVFAGRRVLTVPTTLAGMQPLGPVTDPSMTTDEILAVAEAHRDQLATADTFTYYLLFLDSRYEDSSGTRDTVLGVSLGASGVIAMFKPVIESAASPLFPNLEQLVEQLVAVHELGHAVGLVDNGVPLTTAHKDDPHGAHCTSDRCVMYWQIEGVGDAAAFARQYVTSGSAILFGPECLADVDALTGGP